MRLGGHLMPKNFIKQLLELADELAVGTELIESFIFGCKVKNLTQTTLNCYAERLAYLVRYATSIGRDLDKLTRKDIQSYLMSIMDSVSADTVNGRIRVFILFYKNLKGEGLIVDNPMENIWLVKAEQKIKPVLSADELTRVLSQLDWRHFYGARDYCMILLTYDSMLRVNELLSIKISDLDLHDRLVKVYGKGRKERYVPFSSKTAKFVHTYLLLHRRQIPGDLLFPMKNGGKITLRRAHRIFSRPGEKVGLYIHPHLVRHSSASQFIRMEGNPSVLQKILGHASLTTTQRYVHLSNKDLNEAYERFSPASMLGV
jgi:integrase/recombinase XerD